MQNKIRAIFAFFFFAIYHLAATANAATVTHIGSSVLSPIDPAAKIKVDGIVSTSSELKAGGGKIKTDLQLKATCEKDFYPRRIWTDLYKLKQWTGNHEKKRKTIEVAIDDLPLLQISELVEGCRQLGGNGSYEHKVSFEVFTDCRENPDGLEFDLEIDVKKITRSREINIQVECEDVLPEDKAFARVNNALTYSCPETSREEDEFFWAKYRWVVEGTYSHKVIVKEDLGNLLCIRIGSSRGENVPKLFWSSNE